MSAAAILQRAAANGVRVYLSGSNGSGFVAAYGDESRVNSLLPTLRSQKHEIMATLRAAEELRGKDPFRLQPRIGHFEDTVGTDEFDELVDSLAAKRGVSEREALRLAVEECERRRVTVELRDTPEERRLLNVTLAPAELERGRECWLWNLPKCPHCGARHQHGGGKLDGDPRRLLGHRVAHCCHSNPEGHGYVLTAAQSAAELDRIIMRTGPGLAHKPAQFDDVSGVVYRCMTDVKAQPVRWLWPGRIARGKVTLIAGHPGLGKSQVTVNLAAIVSTGGTFPVDGKHCERGSVVILSGEDDAGDTIRPRLEAAGADLSRCYILDAVREETSTGETNTRAPNLSADLSRFAALLAKLGDVVLLIIDPITAYLGATDSHKNAEIRALLTALAELAARHGVAVVAVSHLTKGAGNEALMRVQGSVGFAAAARAVWGVARDKDNPARRLFLPLKNNLGTDQAGFAFVVEPVCLPNGIETSRIVWEGAPVTVSAEEAFAPDLDHEERSAVEEAKAFLMGLLADGPVSAKQVRSDAEGAGHAWPTIRRAQKALGIEATKDGMRGGWIWRLPPVGGAA